eukprot:Nitzschia sp. Nitz4//scaffold170_size48074//5703//7421//NITZ4_007100-RA/size48074-processed-gene-0.10-mRNA-1//1//CDS//3329538625//9132//frame0
MTGSTTDSSILGPSDLKHLADHGFAVVENFLSSELYQGLRDDVESLRNNHKFHIAKIGHDGMVQDENTPFRDIRHSETCFIGKMADSQLPSSKARHELYAAIDQLKQFLQTNAVVKQGKATSIIPTLDDEAEELMYAYYPQGGYYRRHRDAEPGSVSNWRKYSVLLYLNDMDWQSHHGGQLRIHLDSGADELPPGELPNYIDIQPKAGTLVVFRSDICPHEVMDTRRERLAVVGWLLSKEPTKLDSSTASENPSAELVHSIEGTCLESLRKLRDENPRLKAKLEPAPVPAQAPSALSIWGDDYVLPGAVANPSRAPLQEPTYPDTDVRYWRKIATFDTQGQVNTLSLSAIRLTKIPEDFPGMLNRVVTLDMANTNLPVADLASLLKSIQLDSSTLQQLRLGGNCLGADDLKQLLQAGSQLLSSLHSLDLRYNDLGPQGIEVLAEALAEVPNSCLKTLYLEGTKAGDLGAAALAKLSNLEDLYLGSNGIGPEGAASLAQTAPRHWKKLFLEGNSIGSEGAMAFVDMLTSATAEGQKTLTRLYADNNGMGKEIALKLGNAVGSATLIGDGGLFQ